MPSVFPEQEYFRLLDNILTARPRDWEEPETEDDDLQDPDMAPSEAELPKPWEPATFVTITSPGRPNNAPPSYDDDLDTNPHAAPKVYPAWKPGETFVVSGPYGTFEPGQPVPRGTLYPSRSAARRWAMGKYGAILEEYGLPNKWAFRVPTPGGPHDPRRK